jgi:small ligand-binding sensory domain FIST
MSSTAAIQANPQWTDALAAIGLDEGTPAPAPDLALFFASPEYADIEGLAAQAYRRTAASVLMGCTGGVIGTNREVEDEPAVSLLNMMLPGAELLPRHVENDDLAGLHTPEDWRQWLGLGTDRVNAWVVLTDPYTFDPEHLIQGLAEAYPGTPILGGLASGGSRQQGTMLFLNGDVYTSGAIVLALGGAYTIQAVVAQGATPIGEPWAITGVERNVLHTIGNRPALEVLRDTLNALSDDMRRRAARNLLVGLAIDEYKDTFEQGDFLIRNLLGADPASGALAIGAVPEVGQTIQFQVRDAAAADQDLKRRLALARERLGDAEPAGALLCSCNGRGVGLFGTEDHDARAVSETLGPIPLAGFFCNGEIGPVGGQTYVHGFTASLALFVPVDPAADT